jgi:hypothetical protein
MVGLTGALFARTRIVVALEENTLFADHEGSLRASAFDRSVATDTKTLL